MAAQLNESSLLSEHKSMIPSLRESSREDLATALYTAYYQKASIGKLKG